MAEIKIASDTSALKQGLNEVRSEAKKTQDAIDALAQSIASLPDIPGARASGAAARGTGASGAAGSPGGHAQAVRDEERLHRLRKSHALVESKFRQRLADRQAREDERWFQNAARVNPHLRQFKSHADYQAHRNADPTGAAPHNAQRGMAMNKTMGRIAGVTGGMAGGMIAGNGGTFGMLGGMLGGAAGLLGGPVGMVAGAVLGPVLGALGSKLDQAVQESMEEGVKSANLSRAFGATGFKQVQDASRDASRGMQISYGESAQHAAMYARTAAMRDPSSLREALQGGYGFGKGLGVGAGAGVSFMASMRGTGAAGDEKAARRIGLSVAEAIQKGGLGPQADEVLSAIQNFATSSTHANFSAPDVGSFASMLAAGNNLKLPGLHAAGMASIIQGVDSSIRQGGSFGTASETVSLNAIANLDPSMDVHAARRVMEGGAFGTIAGAYGENSESVKAAEAFLKDAEARGDTASADKYRAELEQFRGFASGPNANVTNLEAQMRMFRGMGTNEMARTMGNHFGLTMGQSSVLGASFVNAEDVGKLSARLEGMGIDLSKMDTSGAFHMASVMNGGHDVLEDTKKRMLEGNDFKALTEKQKSDLNNASGDEQLRVVLLKTLGEVGGAVSAADKAQQAQIDMKSSLARIADKLIPAAEKTAEGINAMVESVAPNSQYGRQLIFEREAKEGVSFWKRGLEAMIPPLGMKNRYERAVALDYANKRDGVRAPTTPDTPGAPTGTVGAPGKLDAPTPAKKAEAAAFAPRIAPNSYKDAGWDAAEAEAARLTNVPQNVLRSVRINGERSNGDQVSPVGARGVYQFMPKTRDLFLKKYGVDAYSTDPTQQAQAAALHLKESYERTGDWRKAVAGYNGGMRGERNPDFTAETAAYHRRVMDGPGGVNAPIPENRAPGRAAAGGGELKVSGEFTLKDEKGRKLDTIKVEPANIKYQPAPAGMTAN